MREREFMRSRQRMRVSEGMGDRDVMRTRERDQNKGQIEGK